MEEIRTKKCEGEEKKKRKKRKKRREEKEIRRKRDSLDPGERGLSHFEEDFLKI